jgi:hypothetical protein
MSNAYAPSSQAELIWVLHDHASNGLCAAETVPAAENGDAYLLRLILHDWSANDSVAILSSLRQAMGNAKAKLLIVEVS